jgi:hypothetical protein
VAETTVTDAALTWTAAAGCLLYLRMLYRAGRRGGGPQRFLISVLACLLIVRGFDWLYRTDALDRATFAFAAGLPLAVTLFVERVLRRHHPLWFKVFSLVATVTLFVGSVFTPLRHDGRFVLAFAFCAAFIVFVNGILLLTRRCDSLSAGENALAGVLVLLTSISVVLVLSDFGVLATLTPVRLGSIAALLLVYSMLGTALETATVGSWAWRYLSLLGVALALAVLISQSAPGTASALQWVSIRRVWPLAYAWILLTAVAVKGRELTAESASTDFIQWLTQAPLRTATEFVETLKAAPGAPSHILLRAQDLREHNLAALERLCASGEPIVSIARARQVQPAPGESLSDSAEQWIDLLERTEMTHGFIVTREPPQVLLLNVPASTLPDQAERRLRVMSHICQQLDQHDQRAQGHP